MVDYTKKTFTDPVEEEIKKPEPLKVAPGEEEIKLTQLDIKLKFSLEERSKY